MYLDQFLHFFLQTLKGSSNALSGYLAVCHNYFLGINMTSNPNIQSTDESPSEKKLTFFKAGWWEREHTGVGTLHCFEPYILDIENGIICSENYTTVTDPTWGENGIVPFAAKWRKSYFTHGIDYEQYEPEDYLTYEAIFGFYELKISQGDKSVIVRIFTSDDIVNGGNVPNENYGIGLAFYGYKRFRSRCVDCGTVCGDSSFEFFRIQCRVAGIDCSDLELDLFADTIQMGINERGEFSGEWPLDDLPDLKWEFVCS